MINFQRIESSSGAYFDEIYELYRSAFPPSERRNLGGFEHVLNYEKRFQCHAILKDGQFVGFFTFWNFEKFIFAEHFAIDSKLRGQNIGSEVMKNFLSLADLPIILEVEMPEDSDSIRRIKFYERFDFKTLSHTYAQPFYDGSGRLLPMLMMSNDIHFADRQFKRIKDTLYSEVYKYESEKD